MIAGASSWLSRKKWLLAGIGVPILVAAWWAFRPEKLWINKQVSEPAPFAVKQRFSTSLHRAADGQSAPDKRARLNLSTPRRQAGSPIDRFHDFKWSGRSRAACAEH